MGSCNVSSYPLSDSQTNYQIAVEGRVSIPLTSEAVKLCRGANGTEEFTVEPKRETASARLCTVYGGQKRSPHRVRASPELPLFNKRGRHVRSVGVRSFSIQPMGAQENCRSFRLYPPGAIQVEFGLCLRQCDLEVGSFGSVGGSLFPALAVAVLQFLGQSRHQHFKLPDSL